MLIEMHIEKHFHAKKHKYYILILELKKKIDRYLQNFLNFSFFLRDMKKND